MVVDLVLSFWVQFTSWEISLQTELDLERTFMSFSLVFKFWILLNEDIQQHKWITYKDRNI